MASRMASTRSTPPGIEYGTAEEANTFCELITPVDEVLVHELLLGIVHVLVEGEPRGEEADEPDLHDGRGGRRRLRREPANSGLGRRPTAKRAEGGRGFFKIRMVNRAQADCKNLVTEYRSAGVWKKSS